MDVSVGAGCEICKVVQFASIIAGSRTPTTPDSSHSCRQVAQTIGAESIIKTACGEGFKEAVQSESSRTLFPSVSLCFLSSRLNLCRRPVGCWRCQVKVEVKQLGRLAQHIVDEEERGKRNHGEEHLHVLDSLVEVNQAIKA